MAESLLLESIKALLQQAASFSAQVVSRRLEEDLENLRRPLLWLEKLLEERLLEEPPFKSLLIPFMDVVQEAAKVLRHFDIEQYPTDLGYELLDFFSPDPLCSVMQPKLKMAVNCIKDMVGEIKLLVLVKQQQRLYIPMTPETCSQVIIDRENESEQQTSVDDSNVNANSRPSCSHPRQAQKQKWITYGSSSFTSSHREGISHLMLNDAAAEVKARPDDAAESSNNLDLTLRGSNMFHRAVKVDLSTCGITWMRRQALRRRVPSSFTTAIIEERSLQNDRFTWRKYGLEYQWGSKYPRQYFRCSERHTLGCLAIKFQVRCEENPNLFEVTYEGTHTCDPGLDLRTSSTSQHLYDDQEAIIQFIVNTNSSKTTIDTTSHQSSTSYISNCTTLSPIQTPITNNRIPTCPSDEQNVFDDPVMVLNPQQRDSQHTTGSTENDPVVFGREDDKKKIIQILLSDELMEHNVSIISIVAAGGIGKTTIADLVYTDPLICEIYEVRGWVRSSAVNDDKGLLLGIIQSLTSISCDIYELSELKEIVEEELMAKRFLLVLDNFCEGGGIFVSELLETLSVGAKGSILLITTRNNMILDNAWRMKSYELNQLSEESCWMIILKSSLISYLIQNEISKRILVSKCEGKPLAAKALGGLLFSAASSQLEDNIDILHNGLWELYKDDGETLPALIMSYNFLSKSLQSCFLSCSLFPKGYIFDKDHLIRLWMSQVFFSCKDEEFQEKMGTVHFKYLLSQGFLQESRGFNDAKKKYYEMHDLVYDFARTIPMDEAFQLVDSKTCSIKRNARHISLVPYDSDCSINLEAIKECKNLHSVLLISKSRAYCWTSQIRLATLKLLEDLFCDLESIKTLNLSFSNIKELPDSIQNLKGLTYLGLNNTNIRKLPESVCSIFTLQTLELQDCAYLHELPGNIKFLVNLRHLDTRKRSGFVGMPCGIGQLTNLRSLTSFSVGKDEFHCGINELKDLRNLKGDICIGGLQNVITKNNSDKADLNKKGGLRSLTLQWSSNGSEFGKDETQGSANEVLACLQPHINLEELIVRDYPGSQLPVWLGDQGFINLVSITIENCHQCNALPPLGQLLSLKYLLIKKMDFVRRLGTEFCGSNVLMNAFPALEVLKMWDMYNWEEWCGVEDGDYPCLRSLSLNKCFKLKSLPCFTSLVELSLTCCSELLQVPKLSALNFLSIEDSQNLKSLILQMYLGRLRRLEVKCCKKLETLVGLNHLHSLVALKLVNCPVLNIAPDEQLPLALQVVNIHPSCSLLLETWCPPGFQEEFSQASRRRLIRDRKQHIAVG